MTTGGQAGVRQPRGKARAASIFISVAFSVFVAVDAVVCFFAAVPLWLAIVLSLAVGGWLARSDAKWARRSVR